MLDIKRFCDVDLVVTGGTIHGVAAALHSSRSGADTALVMSETSPAIEFGSSMGAMLRKTEITHLDTNLLDALLSGADEPGKSGDISLHQRNAIIAVEDLLLDAGVSLYYCAHPVGILTDGNSERPSVCGALFGGKFGLAAGTAAQVVDCTPTALLCRSTGHGTWLAVNDEPRYSVWFLTNTTHDHPPMEFAKGINCTQRGSLAEFTFSHDGESPKRYIRREIIKGMARWNAKHPEHAFVIERAGDVTLSVPKTRLDGNGFAGDDTTGVSGLFCIGPNADTKSDDLSYLVDRTQYVEWAKSIRGNRGDKEIRRATDPVYRLLSQRPQRDDSFLDVDTHDVRVEDPHHDEPAFDTVHVIVPPVPVSHTAELVVLGGGTSGVQAATQAGTLGLKTVCVESHSDVGGTSTVGGVPAYWYGRRTPFFKRLHARLKDAVRTMDLPVSLALFSHLEASGAELMLGASAVGVALADGALTHVLCATRKGLIGIEGNMFIDATGDGDIAAWAGVPYTYGAERDEITLWCSFGSFHHRRDEASRQYMSVVDPRSINDTRRGLIAGRRMGGIHGPGRYVQHYLALRESRHIRGAQTVTYHDVMMGRAFPDAVMYCKSNVDIKGMASSRAALCGYVEQSFLQNYEASIPYGALTPRELSNLIVAGKAYSITHDAVSMARMQPDLMSLGAVSAVAAQQALQNGSVHEVDISELQGRLAKIEVLLTGDLPIGTMDERVPPDEDGVTEIMERLSVKPVESSEWARLLSRATILKHIVDARDVISAEWVKPQIDHLMATMGDPRGNDRLLARLDDMLSGDELPGLAGLERRHDMPDHGFAPKPVYLINALAWTGDLRLVIRLQRVRELLKIDSSVADHRYCYVHSIAYAAEHLGIPEAGVVAEELMSHAVIAATALFRESADPRETVDYIAERYAYLGLCLARGAARCGLVNGYRRLADYTQEIRLYLARSARRELVELMNVDCGFDRQRWLDDIDKRQITITAIPYTVIHQ